MKTNKLSLLLKLGVAFGLSLLITSQFMETPQAKRDRIRNQIGPSVVTITNLEGNSGGTGFFVIAPSGKNYILTNRHVCALAENEFVNVHMNESKRIIKVRVLERAEHADLCLVEAPKSVDGGVEVGSDLRKGEIVSIVGHPKLMALTQSIGEFIGYGKVQVMFDQAPCAKEDETFHTYPTFFGEVCVMTMQAGLTNVLALPGNSGSPVVNSHGKLVGVLFAGDASDNWGVIVRLEDIKDFLSVY